MKNVKETLGLLLTAVALICIAFVIVFMIAYPALMRMMGA